MAIFHFSAKLISRSSGRSVTAAAAYRSGGRIIDERTGLAHDYTRKSGVLANEVLTPSRAPEWAKASASLWNEVEKKEKRKRSEERRVGKECRL